MSSTVSEKGTVPAGLNSHSDALDLFSGGGEMGALMRAFDWSKTPLGPPANWPQSLKTSLSICLASRFPIVLYWGTEYVVLYNDAYSQILGSKHPWALGQTCRVCWAEIWDTIGPMLDGVIKTGKATWSDDLLLMLRRFGYSEECYFSFSFTPVQVESGDVGGVFTAVIETTEKVIGERRLRTLRDLAARTVSAKREQDAWQIAASTLAENRKDLPFVILYQNAGEGFRVVGTAGIDSSHPLCAALCRPGSELFQKTVQVVQSGLPAGLEDLGALATNLPCGPWDTPAGKALLLPIAALGQGPTGVLFAAASPAKALDESYRTFFDLVARQIATSLADARAYEEERKRAEALAELDRAKTLFFTNISHELRTPLTLVLGPTESALSSAEGALRGNELRMVHRNELRLLKLVNTLLDFSRIEAGRVQAAYEPTDVAALTSDLSSVFRSAIEKAGLKFSVQCQPLDQPVYVDGEMWEKIVLNLLSNAFKFTFDGEIALTMERTGDSVELKVHDTGVGIPEAELPHVFERFHRVENTRARTYEGTGIGLALVQELVRLHAGKVRVESAQGQGSTVTVSIPLGTAHLPAGSIQARRTMASTGLSRETWLDEARLWLSSDPQTPTDEDVLHEPSFTAPRETDDPKKELILVADDNPDMRGYLARLLAGDYRVHTVSNGIEALDAARRLHPALVLTDVMMPELDGFGLLHALRADPGTSSIPVIFVTARAGEEAGIEGREAGADDYLVKPFSARELLARVSAHLKLTRMRKQTEDELRHSEERLRLAQQAAAIGAFELDLQTNVNRWTPELEAMYGLPPGGFAGTWEAWEKLIHPGDRAEAIQHVQASMQTNAPARAEWRIVWPDGSVHWISGRWQVFRDESGKNVRLAGVNIDVTEQKNADEARQRLAAIVESSEDAIASKNLDGIITSWNKSAERLFGYKAEEIVGKSVLLIIPPELHSDEDMILSKMRRGEPIEHFETVRLTKGGERIHVSLTISPVRDRDGKIIGAAKIVRDITDSKRIERALRTTEKLAAAGRLAATVAHEMNNPLEAINNLVFLARRDLENIERVKEYLDAAERELDRVAHIARQTLGFYRDSSARVRLSVGKTLDDLLYLYEKRLETRQIRLVRQYDPDDEIIASAGELRQAFSNLISNSIDAMPGGGSLVIRVSRSREWSGNLQTGVRITFLDTGCGISARDREHLFEPFFTTKADVGTGLGLWITKNIVEKHHGVIRFRSRTGATEHGTVFSVFLPSDEEAGGAGRPSQLKDAVA